MNDHAHELKAGTDTVKPAYLPPSLTTYTSDEILAQVGPALTGSQVPG